MDGVEGSEVSRAEGMAKDLIEMGNKDQFKKGTRVCSRRRGAIQFAAKVLEVQTKGKPNSREIKERKTHTRTGVEAIVESESLNV